MTKAEHIKIHENLHKSLDEVAADFLLHNPDKLLSETTVMELLQWSFIQTKTPTEEAGKSEPTK